MDNTQGVRNIGILAHIDAGKTSLTERILYLAGRIRNPGEVDSGTTATDYLEVERERGITVKAACVRLEWRGTRIELIDTPGHVDFGAEVERSLRVLDGAVLLLCAVAGVQSRTEGMLAELAERGIPALAFVNKLDRRGASFGRAFSELAALRPEALALQYPLGEGAEWQGLVDLVGMRIVRAGEGEVPSGGSGDAPAAGAWPLGPTPFGDGAGTPDLPPEALEARRTLVERLAELDDGIMETWASGGEPREEELRAALRKAVLARRVLPVLAGSAFSGAAVSLLLDAIAGFLPAPAEVDCPVGIDPEGGAEIRRRPLAGEPLSGFVFKTQSDERNGRLSWLRLWSGRLGTGDRLVEAASGALLRVQRIFAIQADSLEDLGSAEAGDIVALALAPSGGAAARRGAGQTGGAGQAGGQGLRAAPGSTGSSLCAPGHAILYERLGFDEPVVSVALEPVARADGEALRLALGALLEDDPSLRAVEDGETGRITLSGMGELHLEVAVERLRKEQGVRIRAGRPEVSCREAMRGPAEAHVDFDRDMNGERVRGQLSLRMAPRPRGEGKNFALAAGLRLPAAQVEALRRGIDASASVGPGSAWPVEDFQATVLACQPPTSPRQAELALEMAAAMAARECLDNAGSQVLEPWMRLEITLPEDCLGAAVAALSARGGRIESIEDSGGFVPGPGDGVPSGTGGLSGAGRGKEIVAAASMRRLFGFASELRSATAGHADWQARFLRFEPERSGKA